MLRYGAGSAGVMPDILRHGAGRLEPPMSMVLELLVMKLVM